MLLARHPLDGGVGPLTQLLGLRVAPLLLVQARQIVNRVERVGMLLAQHPLAGGECPLAQRLGLRVAPLPLVQTRDVPRPAPARWRRGRAGTTARPPGSAPGSCTEPPDCSPRQACRDVPRPATARWRLCTRAR